MAQANCDDREAINNNWCLRGGVLGQGMKYETEEPAGHLPMLSHLAPEPGESGESTCNHNVVVAGWFVVLPMDSRSDGCLGPPQELR
jgi:hypothetical protein